MPVRNRPRARSLPSNRERPEVYELGHEERDQPQLNFNRFEIRRILMDNRTLITITGYGRHAAAIRCIRLIQIMIGPILTGLSAALLVRYRTLRQDDCPSQSPDVHCEIYGKAVGTFGYGIVPGILGLVQGLCGLTATYTDRFPFHAVIAVDSIAAGFVMSGGCTAAALINGWNCGSGAMAKRHMCSFIYTAIALSFFGVALSYGLIVAWHYIRVKKRRLERS